MNPIDNTAMSQNEKWGIKDRQNKAPQKSSNTQESENTSSDLNPSLFNELSLLSFISTIYSFIMCLKSTFNVREAVSVKYITELIICCHVYRDGSEHSARVQEINHICETFVRLIADK